MNAQPIRVAATCRPVRCSAGARTLTRCFRRSVCSGFPERPSAWYVAGDALQHPWPFVRTGDCSRPTDGRTARPRTPRIPVTEDPHALGLAAAPAHSAEAFCADATVAVFRTVGRIPPGCSHDACTRNRHALPCRFRSGFPCGLPDFPSLARPACADVAVRQCPNRASLFRHWCRLPEALRSSVVLVAENFVRRRPARALDVT